MKIYKMQQWELVNVISPPGFANWCLWKSVSYLPPETGKEVLVILSAALKGRLGLTKKGRFELLESILVFVQVFRVQH